MDVEATARRVAPAASGVWVRTIKLVLLGSASALAASVALAGPQGGEVVSGSATITNPSATHTQINQQTEKVVIDWKSFNIGANESTVFVQPNSGSVALNRIFDNDPTVIGGLLSANGRLILINRNGMMFEGSSRVNTAGLIATTADIANNDFMSGNYKFETAGNPNAVISNAGQITADQGGVVAFVAPQVKNSGVITAKLGRVELGAGKTFTLDFYGDNLISFPVSSEIVEQMVGPDGEPIASLIDVDGKIDAGSVRLTARAARGIIDNVININGEIIASGILQNGNSIVFTGSDGNAGLAPTGGGSQAAALPDPATAAQSGVATVGGYITVDGGSAGNVSVNGTLTASGSAHGGAVSVTGENVLVNGSLHASGASGAGGTVSVAASGFASLAGAVTANGATGGSINVSASNLLSAARVEANGTTGAGGTVSLAASNKQIATAANIVSATGKTQGGSITVSGGADAGQGLFTSGSYDATSSNGKGGNVSVQGRDIKMIASKVDASGATGGGNINVGFTGQGSSRAIGADSVLISPDATFKADATKTGNGGNITFWSNLTTEFMGTAYARGGAISGNGGLIEVSSLGEIGFWGVGNASAAHGQAGSLLLDPKNLIVSAAGSAFPSYQLIDPNASAGNLFGANIAALATGNTVVTASMEDFGGINAGAVYVFNTTTGGLVSALFGQTANNEVGSGGITVLSNNNFVVSSAGWDTAANNNAGAATWGSGTLGINGVVNASNSLVGSAANHNVANLGVTALANGNYVVRSSNWDNGATTNVGAVTWGNGATGTSGTVGAANSLIGSTANDNVGSSGIVELTNGNYVVRSQNWDNGAAGNAGAITWASGTGPTTGAVTAANSMVGSTANDTIGSNGVLALTNGNFLVVSSAWDNGAAANAGSARWGNGLGGSVGAISAANAIVGAAANAQVGNEGAVALTNGNYVVASSLWDSAGNNNVGAVTWGNGLTGTVGVVSAANSLVGTSTDDEVGNGGVVALANGNYVVISFDWDGFDGAITWGNGSTGITGAVSMANSLSDAGSGSQLGTGGVVALPNGNYLVLHPNFNTGTLDAVGSVTFGNGTFGVTGTVSAANSLVGSQENDQVGSGGVTVLSNGNYVVRSPNWDNGAIANAGAATWGNGGFGLIGAVSAANSLVGTTANDNVSGTGVTALTNGNYVVRSANWDNGAVANAGAATWGNGASGTSGTVSAANSLVGTTANDNVSGTGVTALSNGNYVVRSANWDNGAATNAGAATWGSGTGGTVGAVSAANSLVGSTTNDNVGGTAVNALTNGDYVVTSSLWNNGATADVGAVTLGNGVTGTSGVVTSTNSLIGSTANAQLNFAMASTTNEILARSAGAGTVLVGLTDPNQLTFARAQGQTLTVNPAFITRTLSSGTAVTLQASNDLSVLSDLIVNNPLGNGGNLSLQAGRSVVINADITTDNGNLTIVANELLGAGVVNAQRDAGAAVLSMGAGADINAGTGNVRLTIASGAGKTNTASGDMTLGNITANSIIGENLGPSNGNVIINAGSSLIANGAGNALTLAAQGGNFINNSGASALQAANGRWVVYSQSPFSNTLNGLTANPYYNTLYNSGTPGSLPVSGNRLAYTLAPNLTVTADTQSRPYGQSNDGLTYQITGYINGDAPGLAVSGAPSLTSSATTTSAVGSGPHPIFTALGTLASDYNYGFQFVDGLLSITGAQLFYLADPKSRSYGDPNGALTGQLTGLVNGDTLESITDGTMTFSTGANNLSNVGSYAINGSGLTVTNGNYIVTILQDPTNATALTVTPAQLTYLANAASRIYGDANPALSGTIYGLKNGEALNTVVSGDMVFNTPAIGTTNVGSHAINGSGLLVVNSNYAATITQDTFNATALTINPAQLFYKANSASREYGDANPLFSGQVLGLKNGELYTDVTTGGLNFTSTANTFSSVAGGPYAINGSGLAVTSSNYLPTILQDPTNASALTITQAQLYYLADPKSRAYGDANPALTGSLLGLKNGDTLADLGGSGTLTFSTSATSASGVGSYAINGSGLVVSPTANYSATILQHASNATALTINPAQLFYKADPKSRTYGDANPALTGTVTGLKNGETLDAITDGTVIFTTVANNTTNVGSYAIDGSGLTVTSANYVATVLQDPTNATALTINQAQLFYLANTASRIYGDNNPAFSGTVTGFKNGQTLTDVATGTATFISPTDSTTNAGSYAINGTGLTVTNTNYAATVFQDPSNATALTITPAQLTYLANAASRIYGDANPTFTGQVLGLKNGDTLAGVTDGALGFQSPAGPTASVLGGPYAINGVGLTVTSGNYQTIISQDAFNATALTITPAQLFYQATPITMTYGDEAPAVTGILGGRKNGESVATVATGTLNWTTDFDGNAGIFSILGDGLTVNNSNYLPTILQAPGNATAFTVNQRQLFYLADPTMKMYGTVNPTFTGTVINVADGELLEDIVSGTMLFTSPAQQYSPAGHYAIDGSGLTVLSPNYIATILQDPSNAIALTIGSPRSATDQAMQETHNGQGSVFDQADEGHGPSRDSDLKIEGVTPVSPDMADGKNDEMMGQLCVLGVPEAGNSPDCNGKKVK